MAFWMPLICSPAVQSLPHPGAPRGDGPRPDLQRLHWPTAARRVPANNCTKNALAPGSLSGTNATDRNFTFLWLLSRVRAKAPWQLCVHRKPTLAWKANCRAMKLAVMLVFKPNQSLLYILIAVWNCKKGASNQTENDTTLSGKTPIWLVGGLGKSYTAGLLRVRGHLAFLWKCE